jgi:hypothetical protein
MINVSRMLVFEKLLLNSMGPEPTMKNITRVKGERAMLKINC